MNLFLLAWNFPDETVPTTITKLREMREIYPQLDIDTIWSFSRGNKVFAASMHTSEKVSSPRVYVKKNNNEVVLYDGCLVNPAGKFQAHDANQLSSNWNKLPEELDGQFVISRITINPAKIEVLTDFLGIYQTYYLQQNNTWLISNNVRLLRQISNKNEFDPIGVSSHLALNQLAGNHTLIDGIRAMQGSQSWIWKENTTEPVCKTYFIRSKLFRQPQRKLDQSGVERLSNDMMQLCQSLSQSFGSLECPITGGRDSRLMTALLVKGCIDAEYFSTGNPQTLDVKIGCKIAECCKLPHVTKPLEYDDIIDNWDNASRQLIMQTDGMTRLLHVGVALNQPNSIERLPVHLYGLGGEMARGWQLEPSFFKHRHNVGFMQNFLIQHCLHNSSGLFVPQTLEMAKKFLQQFVIQLVEEDIRLADIPASFLVFNDTPRWGGTNFRQVWHYLDVFAPFCTRPFIEVTFAIPAIRRYSEHVHYQMLQYLTPDLHCMPFEALKGEGWPPQKPAMVYYNFFRNSLKRRVANKFQHLTPKKVNQKKVAKSQPAPARALHDSQRWIEAKKLAFREICLDQTSSPLWKFLDRSRFEYLTLTQNGAELLQKKIICDELLNTVALFQYASYGI